jgi:hypothetical protein
MVINIHLWPLGSNFFHFSSETWSHARKPKVLKWAIKNLMPLHTFVEHGIPQLVEDYDWEYSKHMELLIPKNLLHFSSMHHRLLFPSRSCCYTQLHHFAMDCKALYVYTISLVVDKMPWLMKWRFPSITLSFIMLICFMGIYLNLELF